MQQAKVKGKKLSCIITFHNEGIYAHKTLLSVANCYKHANQNGILVDLICILDSADKETTRIVSNFFKNKNIKVLLKKVSFSDPCKSRNYGASISKSEFIAFFDGDDLFSENLITSGLMAIIKNKRLIAHPEIIFRFTEDGRFSWYWQFNQSSMFFSKKSLFTHNLWNTCCISRRDIFLACPYRTQRPDVNGFGYDDWSFNIDTIQQGFEHIVIKDTVRFERGKTFGSQNNFCKQENALVVPSVFFDNI